MRSRRFCPWRRECAAAVKVSSTDAIDVTVIRELDGYAINKDPSMAGAFVLKLCALEAGIVAAAAAAAPPVAYAEVLTDVMDANRGGAWRGKIAHTVEPKKDGRQ